MKGLVELQNGIYRSVAVILKGYPSVNSLTDEQKSKLELTFKIGEGSTTSEADGAPVLDEAYREAAKKMSGKQLFILALVLGLVWTGKDPYVKTLDANTEQARIAADLKREEMREAQAARRDDMLSQSLADNRRILDQVMRQNQEARKIAEQNSKSVDVILRNTSDADYVVLQDRVFSKEKIDVYNKRVRRKSDGVSLDTQFVVLAIESLENTTFRARVRKFDTGEEFMVDINDQIVISRSMRNIQKALVSDKPARLRIDARRKGGDYYEAKLIRAYPPAK